MNYVLDLRSERSRAARLAGHFSGSGPFLLGGGSLLFAVGSVCWGFIGLARVGYLACALACLLLVFGLWARYYLRQLDVKQPFTKLDDVLEPVFLSRLGRLPANLSPQQLWQAVVLLPEGRFMSTRLLLGSEMISQAMSSQAGDGTDAIWDEAVRLLSASGLRELHAGMVATALLTQTPALQPILDVNELTRADILEVLSWLNRNVSYQQMPRHHFGGIGRDWTSGFTPHLEHYGSNLSQALERVGGAIGFTPHTSVLPTIASNLGQGNSVAIISQPGVGKDALIAALATQLLEGKESRLQYYQVVSLSASAILADNISRLEQILLTIAGEAVGAGNIILYLDEAELFFGSGVGAFDMSQVLLPIVRSRNLHLIAAFTPAVWQELQAHHSNLASSFAAVTLPEPNEADSLKVIEDGATLLEQRSQTFISYEAIREAYRLSGQYIQEEAYPGKAAHLLEQALPYGAENHLVEATTVQQALEKAKGVKVSRAAAPEADMLLHLEDRIHERMINQTRAVSVVASALRRGRAGVTNPKRPVGSFLFLGPTGVGKTELARSLAAVYFGDEQNMIRLDMSEYQQSSDVSRLLSGGSRTTQSLLQAIRQQPFAVVLLDEIEKAHPNILNLFLQLLDEGQLTDDQGHQASFRNSIIIATSNAGAVDIAQRVQKGQDLESFTRPLIDNLIASGQFKPELMNRFDEIVLFRPLNESELSQVAKLMLREVNHTLETKRISVELSPEALQRIVKAGYDPQFGARPMRRIVQQTVENAVAVKILEGKAPAGSVIMLDESAIAANLGNTGSSPDEQAPKQ